MSDVPQHIQLSRQFSGRWQIPLLILATGFLAAGLWRLRPVVEPPSFDQLIDKAVAMKNARLYPEAGAYIESLMNDPKRPLAGDESGRLHVLMAEVIYAHEQENVIHGGSNAEAILSHLDAAAADGQTMTAERRLMRARASEWLGSSSQAVVEYREALAAGIDDPWSIRQRVLQIERETHQISTEALHKELDAFIAASDIGEDLRYWAAEQKVMLLAEEGKYQEADRVLTQHADRFQAPTTKDDYAYLRALVAYYLDRAEESERELRVLRDRAIPARPLYARTGWLLGRIMQGHEAPQPALSFFEDVLSKTIPGPYYTLSMLGRAESLAALRRYDESVQAYREVIRLVSEDHYGSLVDLQVVRQSTTTLYEALRAEGRLADAMAYLRIAAPLAPAGDMRLQMVYAERQGDLAYAIGRQALDRARAGASDAEAERQIARASFIEAADHYLRLAKLPVTEDAASSAALWRAAAALDLAGEHQRRAEVLESFIRERPGDTRVPEALLRLGETYQAIDSWDKAIEAYQQNLTDFPRAYWAVRCLVPLAECFLDTRQMEKAEQTLLRVVDRSPDDPLPLIKPEAQEYRDALFRLGDLYIQSEEYEKAIGRFEEALRRYPEDKRSDRVAFLMADAYRRSAAQIRADLEDPRKVAFKDELKVQHQDRLKRAEELFVRVIERYRDRSPDSLSDLDRQYVKLSYFYRADAIYDRSRLTDPSDMQPYVQSLQRYDEAAWLYQYDPAAMSAYVQMVNCHLRMGNIQEARKALRRAGWALRNIPEDRFDSTLPGSGREYWEKYLSWLEKTPMFVAQKVEG